MSGPTPDTIIAALTYPGLRWFSPSITFSIPTEGALWPGYPAGTEPYAADYGFLSSSQRDAFRQAVGAWARLIPLEFVETSDQSQPGQIRVAFSSTVSHASYPGTTEQAGDVWLDSSLTGTWEPAGNGGQSSPPFKIVLHELGHTLGLGHPHEAPTPLPRSTPLPLAYDSVRYSMMSYNSAIDNIVLKYFVDPTSPMGWSASLKIVVPTEPMVYDILAVQYLYGENTHSNSGDDVYTWSEEDGFFDAIYDAGGTDTFDLSAHRRGSVVDLTPGAYSSVARFTIDEQKAMFLASVPAAAAVITRNFDDPYRHTYGYTWTDNVGIAFSTLIENVRCGSGADTVQGNVADNSLSGGPGDDRLMGDVGSDTLEGGAGANFLRGGDGNDIIFGGPDFDDTHGNVGDDTVHGGGFDDWVVGGQGNDVLFGDDGGDLCYGNLGADTVDGGAGSDGVVGGQGNDVLNGGAGDDFIITGDRGDDTLTGGAGADTFRTFNQTGVDRVTDFNPAEGDRVVVDVGSAYTLSQVGADTVIDMGGGNQMVLVGVTLSSLPAGWITGG